MKQKIGIKGYGSKLIIKEKAQSTIEYALLIAVVAAAFIAMQVYMQRAVQANFKLMEEQVNVAP